MQTQVQERKVLDTQQLGLAEILIPNLAELQKEYPDRFLDSDQ
jgi:hypothetical protein